MYTSPCNDCEHEYNIGKIKRQFRVRLKEREKAVFLSKNMLTRPAMKLGEICNSNIITTNWRYHQRLSLEAWHINSVHALSKRDHGGLLPYAYLHLIDKM